MNLNGMTYMAAVFALSSWPNSCLFLSDLAHSFAATCQRREAMLQPARECPHPPIPDPVSQRTRTRHAAECSHRRPRKLRRRGTMDKKKKLFCLFFSRSMLKCFLFSFLFRMPAKRASKRTMHIHERCSISIRFLDFDSDDSFERFSLNDTLFFSSLSHRELVMLLSNFVAIVMPKMLIMRCES